MTSAPAILWSLTSCANSASAGGQLEQPSDVKSSTTTAGLGLSSVCLAANVRLSSGTVVRRNIPARANREKKATPRAVMNDFTAASRTFILRLHWMVTRQERSQFLHFDWSASSNLCMLVYRLGDNRPNLDGHPKIKFFAWRQSPRTFPVCAT